VYSPRFTAETTFNPAVFQSAKMNSPGRSEDVLLVSGTIMTSCEECEEFTTTDGLTFEPDKFEKGYRTRMTSFFE
jgi:hypothetical protein